MFKYTDTQVTFLEIPDEITLCINISGCPNHCAECHSAYLAEDIGEELTYNEILRLITLNAGITCIAFMGGDQDPHYVNQCAEVVRLMENAPKIAWYSGKQELSPEIQLKNFDYIKLGPYISSSGPLNCPTTNQRLYKVVDDKLIDITEKFWK